MNAPGERNHELDEGPFYHGTKADLEAGDLLEPGYRSNYGTGRKANFLYFTATMDAAVWGAELASGEGQGRIYLVEPTGTFENDPNLTDKRFPGNPTRSYRTREPLRVVGEVRERTGRMNHKGTVRIETERLVLRRFREDDAAAAFRNWTSDDRITEYLRWPTHESLAVTERVLAEWIAKYEDPGFYQWAVVPKAGADEPIGTISVVDRNERLDIVHIGYCIGSRWWNRGFTSEAFAAVILFLFDEVGVNRIESQHDPANPGSGKVMAKCGLHYEGTLRQADVSNQGVVDAAMYGLLASEWRAGKLRRSSGEDPRLHELEEAKRALVSLLAKCEKALLKLTPGKSQHTLMVRRIRAFEISIELIEKESREHGT